ncbi:MAG: DNA polymerase III subunit beta [Bacteroidota bacterium]|nr:DNA polymerase III subunit beta [Candidatus Kapabacteria bacterium]MCS7302444.1 DNA polymerase III subunit beta [Candidatus Kapabacteria bacterium]MCX7936333.1 DNA polymerase III subunit beta [Chlorobiota bacterium]MDW8074386.1 DNA polymerase III subunit beta [Bacteroidota bacterium]MDW8271138.1 DNA polymerase III subunit beta [Bacteroidota bacterium]
MHIAHTTIADLVTALGRIIPAIPPKSTIFVLEHALLSADSDQVELTATDTELAITTHIPAHVATSGTILVPARKLYDVVRALPDDLSCEVNVEGEKLIIKTNIGRYEFPALNAAEFPELPRVDHATTVVLSESDARTIAEAVTYAASSEQYRPAMTGVKFEIGNTLVAVATDGYRLATMTIPLEQTFHDIVEAIVPARVVELLAKVEGEVMLGFTKTHALISDSRERIVARLIDESYPQWRNVIPNDNDKVATVNRTEFLKAIRRVALFTSAASQMVRFRFADDTVTLTVVDPDTGARAEEHLACQYASEPLEIGFNHKYIAEALAHLPGEQVQLAFSAPSRAALLTPVEGNEYSITTLVMPMRLG